MDDDEPIVSIGIKIVWDLIIGVPWIVISFFVAMSAGFDEGHSQTVLTGMAFLPMCALGVWMFHGTRPRVRNRCRAAAGLFTAAWLACVLAL